MNLKTILPFENYILVTDLPVHEVQQRIGEIIQPPKPLKLLDLNRNYSRPYTGTKTGAVFKMSRNIYNRNSFLPVISGEIFSYAGKTRVHIRMMPVTFVIIFMSVWLGFVGLLCVGLLLYGISNFDQILQTGFSPMTLIPFVMFVFGCLLFYFAFKTESKISKKFLAELLQESN